jgi:hypothetical protein
MLKNIDGGPPGPHGGAGPHLGSEGCVVNLHGHDRQRVILLTGPTTLRLVLVWLTTLDQLMWHG